MWFFPGFGIRPGRKVTWSKVLQVLRTRGCIVRLLPPKWYYFRGAGSKATCGYFNEKPHTIADDMVSQHVITLFFVLLATRRIQKTVPSVGWYILPPKWQKLW